MLAAGASAIGAVTLITARLGSSARAKKLPAAVAHAQEAQAPAAAIVLIPRGQWGAEPPQVSAGGRGEHGLYDPATNPDGWLVYDQPLEDVLEMVIIHHSALPLSDGPREIQQLHLEERGFADIGYQFLINETGQIYEGRALDVRGAHTLSFNYGTIGICLIGNFEEIEPTSAQIVTLDTLLTDLLARFPRITRLAGHNDLNPGATLCPGGNLKPLLPAIAAAHGLSYGVG